MITLRRIFLTLRLLACLILALPATGFANGILGVDELEALAALRYGNATHQQRALLFARNDAINRAALRGYITDDLYQSAQREFARLNARIAEDAAREAGAQFRVQTSTSPSFSPGTDSDYITRVSSPDQVSHMQESYNRRVNAFLRENGVPAGRNDWHVQLDTDFMADPSGVTEEQFREIAKLNNDAYKRRAAAVYEAVSRADDGTRISPELFTEYSEEMKDFIAKKRRLLAEMRSDPRRLTSPDFQAEFHKIMAQEQKYISRIEASDALLRSQRGLPEIRSDISAYSLQQADDGAWVMRRNASLAQRGARRTAGAFRTAALASALSQNSLENAVEGLARSMAEAAARDPDFAARGARDIAALFADFPPSRKGDLIASIARNQGDDFAREVAAAMRVQHRGALQAGRAGLRAWAGRLLDVFGKGATAYELYQAGSGLHEYASAIYAATDPDISDAEADALFRKAEDAGWRLGIAGGTAALFEAFPQLALAMGEFAIVNYGTRWMLENTETGRAIDLGAGHFFDAAFRASEAFSCSAKEFVGIESECERLRNVEQGIVERILRGIREGRLQLADGATMRDVLDMIRTNRIGEIGTIVVDSGEWQAAEAALGDLDARLAALRERCVPTTAARPAATGEAPPDGGPDRRQSCLAAQQASTGLAEKEAALRTLAASALSGFEAAGRGLAECRGSAQLDRSFAQAQAASSNAADAARAFADLDAASQEADAAITEARQEAEQGLRELEETARGCTADINALIDATAAARERIPWDRLRARADGIEDAAVGVAESRGNGTAARQAALFSDCARLPDPFETRLRGMETVLTLEDVPGLREGIESAAQACRDELDADAPPAISPVTAPADPAPATGAHSPAPARQADPEALQACLCGCAQGRTNFSCTYDTEDTGWSPSCRNLSNGPCICKAFGCFRTQPVASGECHLRCVARHGGQ